MTEADLSPSGSVNTGAVLSTGDVHVWLTDPDQVTDPGLLEAYRRMLGEDERRRYARFRLQRHRHLYLVAHALVRTTLSRYTEVAPGAWTFSTNAHGRPEIDHPRTRLRFNLSHTDGLVACGVTSDADLGVDVESLARRRVNLRIAERFFSAPECRALRGLDPDQRPQRFLELWTLKEAYIKARGFGLALPLRSFAFSFPDGGVPRIRFLEGQAEDPSDWCFEVRAWEGTHVLSVGVKTPASKARIRYRATRPLGPSET